MSFELLCNKKDELGAKIAKLCLRLSELNEALNETLPHATFTRLKKEQVSVKKEIATIQEDLAKVKAMLRRSFHNGEGEQRDTDYGRAFMEVVRTKVPKATFEMWCHEATLRFHEFVERESI
jgi:G3E family GTPase